MTGCFLSIIIPVLNEENRLTETINNIIPFLKSQSFSFEIIVVENGSTDNTYQLARELSNKLNEVLVMNEPKRGKGRAVQKGIYQESIRSSEAKICHSNQVNKHRLK